MLGVVRPRALVLGLLPLGVGVALAQLVAHLGRLPLPGRSMPVAMCRRKRSIAAPLLRLPRLHLHRRHRDGARQHLGTMRLQTHGVDDALPLVGH